MARVKAVRLFYLPPTYLSANGVSHPAFTPQPQDITTLCLVLISVPQRLGG